MAIFDTEQELVDIVSTSSYGQQAAIFTNEASTSSSYLLDVLSTSVGRVNINTQCGRSPDTIPFSGRKSSAMGTMSISAAINEFSIETVVAAKFNDKNEEILRNFANSSNFLAPVV